MKVNKFQLLLGSSLFLAIAGCGGSSSHNNGAGSNLTVNQANLVADTAGIAATTDPNLVNPWGVSYSPGGDFWVSDNGTGLSTLYDGTGAASGLVVTIPAASGLQNGPVTGQVYNGDNTAFTIPASTSAVFIFDSEDGLITAWNGSSGSQASTVADRSGSGAVYKGLAIASNGGSPFLYASNFNSGNVDVFDTTFTFVKSFTDSTIPTGFAPFGIFTINNLLYVTYAKQDAQKHDDVPGAGNGYVDVFNPDGTLNKRLVSTGALNSPWGLAVAPSSFTGLSGQLLVGNFGDGKINAYNLSTGASLGALQGSGGAVTIPGLWDIIVGNGGVGAPATTLFFTAGPGGESHGLFGSLTPAQ